MFCRDFLSVSFYLIASLRFVIDIFQIGIKIDAIIGIIKNKNNTAMTPKSIAGIN